MDFPWVHSFPRASTCSDVGSSTGCRWISAPSGTPMGCRGTAASPWSASRAAGESQLQCLEQLLFLLQQSVCVCRAVSLTYPHSCSQLLLCSIFLSLSLCCPRGTATITDGLGLGQWCVHLGPTWHRLCQTHQEASHIPVASHYQNLILQTKYRHMLCKKTREMIEGMSFKQEAFYQY